MPTIECPDCGARFNLSDDLAGRRARCTNCQTVIEPAAPPPLPVARLLLPPAAATPRRPDPDDFDDRPRRRRRSAEPPVQGTRVIRILLIVGGLMAVLGAVVITAAVMAVLDAAKRPGARDGFVGIPEFKPPAAELTSLPDARKGFTTTLTRRESANQPAPDPPPAVFRKVEYPAPAGDLVAYLTPDPGDGKKHPAIVWITGGDCNTIDPVWTPAPSANDQTASAYRKAGVVMMFPSLRGGNDNPGVREGFYGEVDDALAALDYLGKQSYVDPTRVYLGGHSTGGTLAMLVAESSDKPRGVFSFGPADDVSGYGNEFCPFNLRDRKEVELRSPGRWLHSVKCPLFVFEGTNQGNLSSLEAMKRQSTNPLAHFHAVRGGNHFDTLDPLNRLIASKILADTGPTTNISLTDPEVMSAYRNPPVVRPPGATPPAAPLPAGPKGPTPDWVGAGADSISLSNPRLVGETNLTFDYEITTDPPARPLLVWIMLKTGDRTARSPFPLTPRPRGSMTVSRPGIGPGTEVWLARTKPGASPKDEPERLSNTVTVP